MEIQRFHVFDHFTSERQLYNASLLNRKTQNFNFQAVCKDNLFPYISFFGKGYGVNEEPKRGFILAAIIALAMVMIGRVFDEFQNNLT